jgi:hypothetical protein
VHGPYSYEYGNGNVVAWFATVTYNAPLCCDGFELYNNDHLITWNYIAAYSWYPSGGVACWIWNGNPALGSDESQAGAAEVCNTYADTPDHLWNQSTQTHSHVGQTLTGGTWTSPTFHMAPWDPSAVVTLGDIHLIVTGTGGSVPPLPASQAFATNECPFCNNSAKVYTAGMGINASSGNYNHQLSDGQVAGAGAWLSFERSYNSLTSGTNPAFPTYNDVLGYGWTHNYNLRLILPTDPGGQAGRVKLIAPRGSVMQFTDNGDGTYSPFPAVLATLTRTGSPGSYVYTFNNDRHRRCGRSRTRPGS